MTGIDRQRPRIGFGLPSSGPSGVPSIGRVGAAVGALVIVALLASLLWSAALAGTPVAAIPHLFGGSLVLDDTRPPTVIELATAQITVRLDGVDEQVGSSNYEQVEAVPATGGTFLVNRTTGTFNYLDSDDYVADPKGSGVALATPAGLTGAEGVADGADLYVVRSAPQSAVALVSRSTVVQAATASAGPVHPLGQGSLAGLVSLAPGSAVPAGGDLWVLEQDTAGCHVTRLQPNPYSPGGLQSSREATVTAGCSRAALESATLRGRSAGTKSAGTAAGGEVVALAEPGMTTFFGDGSRPERIRMTATEGASAIMPVSGADGGWWFLYRVASGWDAITVTPAGAVRGPWPLPALGPASNPAPPALSGGYLYTLDRNATGQPGLLRISTADGRESTVPGVARYPLRSALEKDSFTAAEVTVDGPRVVFNNPDSLEAVVVFTDGSHSPVVVDKSRAVDVSTTGPADLSATPKQASPSSKGPTPTPAHPQAVPVQVPVSQQITCANTTQKPYVPQITSATVSSGSVLVSWSYSLLDESDCEPDSWAVHVVALSTSHQPADPTVVVDGQTQALVTGLRPATTYSVTVTAYINKQSTSSEPVSFTTSPRGPDAPLSVTTTADGAGNWVVSWVPCDEATHPDCVVPADQWNIVASACGGSYVGSPPSVQVGGTQDSVTINAGQLGLLGDYLTFSVYGNLSSGLNGPPTSDGECTQAWQQPNASDIALTAEGTPEGSTITATLQVATTGDPTQAFGVPAADAEFVYSVGGHTVGPTNAPKVTVDGLPPGQQFTPTVVVYPAGHQGASVTVIGAPFTQTLPWPDDLVNLSAAGTVDSDPNQGTVTVTFPSDVPSGPLVAVDSKGDPASAPQIICGGSSSVPGLATTAVRDGKVTLQMADLVDYGGDCSVRLALLDTASPDPYGGPSPELDADFTIGTQPDYSFAAVMAPPCNRNGACGPLSGGIGRQAQPWKVEIDQTGGPSPQAGGDWVVQTATATGLNPGGPADPCSVNPPLQLSTPPQFPYQFDLPGGCPDGNAVDIKISWKYLGTVQSPDLGTPSGGGAPATTTTTTVPCPTTTSTGQATTSTTDCSSPAAFSEAAPADRVTAGGDVSRVATGVAAGLTVIALVALIPPRRRRLRAGRPAR